MIKESEQRAAFEAILDLIGKQKALKRQADILVKDFEDRFGISDYDYAAKYFSIDRQ